MVGVVVPLEFRDVVLLMTVRIAQPPFTRRSLAATADAHATPRSRIPSSSWIRPALNAAAADERRVFALHLTENLTD